MSPPLTVELFVSDAAAGRVAEIQRVLEQDCDAQAVLAQVKDMPDSHGDTAIGVAVKANNIRMLKFLLEVCKCNPNGPVASLPPSSSSFSSFRTTPPLHTAARQGSVDAVRLLCEYGADVNAKAGADGWTPLHISCFSKKTETALALLEQQQQQQRSGGSSNNIVDPFIPSDAEGATALHFAASQGGKDIVRAILSPSSSSSPRAPPTPEQLCAMRNNKGETVLHSALHFSMSKTLGGKYMPPEPQWEIAIMLAMAGCAPSRISRLSPSSSSAVASVESATHFVSQKFPAMETALESLAAAKIDAGKTLQLSSENKQIPSSFYDFLISASEDEICHALRGCSKEHAGKISAAMKQLEQERQAARSAAAGAAKLPPTATVLDAVMQKGAQLAVDPHGMGIDIRSIKDGDDPSHGECPFLKMRADQVKARKSAAVATDAAVSDFARVPPKVDRADPMVVRISIAIVSFAAGWIACRVYGSYCLQRSIKS